MFRAQVPAHAIGKLHKAIEPHPQEHRISRPSRPQELNERKVMSHAQVDLKGKVVMITGASRGIGKAMATRMASHGANLVLAARSPGALG